MKVMVLGSNEINIFRVGVGVSWVWVSWFFWCLGFFVWGFWHRPDNATVNKTRLSAFVKMVRQNLKHLVGKKNLLTVTHIHIHPRVEHPLGRCMFSITLISSEKIKNSKSSQIPK